MQGKNTDNLNIIEVELEEGKYKMHMYNFTSKGYLYDQILKHYTN